MTEKECSTNAVRFKKYTILEKKGDTWRSIPVTVPENGTVEVEGDIECEYFVRTGSKTIKYSTFVRNQYRDAKKRKSVTFETEEERMEREREQRKRREVEDQRRWDKKDPDRKLTREQHKQLDREEKEAMAKRGRAEVKRGMGMAPMTAVFKPVSKEEQQRREEAKAVAVEAEKEVVTDQATEQEKEEAGKNEENEKAFVFGKGRDVYLRLAFVHREEIDTLKKTAAAPIIREKGMIGPVKIEEMVDENVAKLDLVEFSNTLYDHTKRLAGKHVSLNQFRELKKALEEAQGKVSLKYLALRKREDSENMAWTPEQVEKVVEAVEKARMVLDKEEKKSGHFSKATEFLNSAYNGKENPLGRMNKNKVRYVYIHRDTICNRSDEATGQRVKRGRPCMLSKECLDKLKAFANSTARGNTRSEWSLLKPSFERIIRECNEEASFADKCANPSKYLRSLYTKFTTAAVV